MLLALTVVTGLVDAVSILSLGRVFVANMTGNVVFVGFAIAGAPGFSLGASLCALAGFVVGAGTGGRLVTRLGSHRGRVLLVGSVVEFVFVGGGLLLVSVAHSPFPGGIQDATAAVVAVALGVQNAVVRGLAVPDLTTTVLTMTLTGLAADTHGAAAPTVLRRALGVTAMFAGAIVGAVLVIDVAPAAALGTATATLAGVFAASWWVSTGDRAWHHPPV